PALEDVVFGDTVLNQGRVGGPVALGEDRLVVVKVLEHRKPAARPLPEVQAAIVTAMKQEQGLAAAKAAADAALKRLQAGESFGAVRAGRTMEGPRYIARIDPSVPSEIRTSVFSLPRPEGKPLYEGVPVAGGIAVVEVSKVRADPVPLSADARQERMG